jgi:hypothetical protein
LFNEAIYYFNRVFATIPMKNMHMCIDHTLSPLNSKTLLFNTSL